MLWWLVSVVTVALLFVVVRRPIKACMWYSTYRARVSAIIVLSVKHNRLVYYNYI